MRKDILIEADSKNSRVYLPTSRLGICQENLQGNLIVKFKDEFVDGTAWLELEMEDGTNGYLPMTKVDESYVLPIKSSLLKQEGDINFQIRITEGINPEEVPVWKSNVFYLTVDEALNTTEEIPDEYPQWIDIANAKLNEIDNLNLDVEKEEDTATITVTKKDGTTKIVQIKDGAKGDKGDKGDVSFATFDIEDGYLVMNKDYGLDNINFSLTDNGYLEVEING